jgi:5-methylcytosine-specific restriction endonuclease McrA
MKRRCRGKGWRKKTLLQLQHGLCPWCGQLLTFKEATLDHIFPKSKGGLKAWHNIQLLHRKCNSEKGDRLLKHRNRFTLRGQLLRPYPINLL